MDHPGERDFVSIRGKTPAHTDHKRVSANNSDYMSGGSTGFNLQEGVAGERSVAVSPHERAMPMRAESDAPMMPSMPMPTDAPMTTAGVDFQVPPIKKY